MNFRPDIQGLRAVAVLSVIIFHLNPAWLPGGFVGVDIFLVISGFLITSILLHKKAKPDYSLPATLSYFYTSRLKRIVPAYFTTLVVVSLVAGVLFLPADFSTYRDGLKQAAYFNSNNYFADFGDYFAPANHEQPLLHTWSLAIEIQFYLIAPFIFLLVARKYLQWLLPAAIILLTAYAEYRLQAGIQQATYYSLLARLPAFFLGGCVALWINNNNWQREGDRLKLWLSRLAIGLLVFALVIPKPAGHFPGLAALVPTVAAALIIWLNANNSILSCKTMVWIGALSYSLYLWHWPVLAFMRYYTGAEVLDWQFSLAFIGITLGLAAASYYWIETQPRLKRSAKQIFGYVFLLLITVTTAAGLKRMNAHFTPEPLPIEYTRYADPETICHGKIVGDCLKGDLSSDKEVLVLGDSHAAMLTHFFDYLGKELGFKARIITASSCVTIPEFDYQRIPEYAQKACVSQIAQASQYINHAETIFLAGKWSRHFDFEGFSGALNAFLDSLQQEQRLFVFGQVPFLKQNPIRTTRFIKLGLPNSIDELDRQYMDTNKMVENTIMQYGSNTAYLDTQKLDVFGTLPVFEGELIYHDRHHLNEIGSLEYAREFRNKFSTIMRYQFTVGRLR